MNKPKVLLVVGPTAVGKTQLSIELAKQFNGEVISGDSMQVYRHLDIGTAKVTSVEQEHIPHYLIDIREVSEGFTVAQFVDEATNLIRQITARGKLPIIVGGTGFYLQALLDGLRLGSPADKQRRQFWQTMLAKHDQLWLWQQLDERDPKAADQIPMGNSRRVIRALEVFESTGHSILEQERRSQQFDALIVGLTTDRAVLYERINHRVDEMMTAGLIEEARWLYERRQVAPQASRGIGYKELFEYFEDQESLNEAIAAIKQHSRHYAKRQLTWFRHQLPVEWFDLVSGADTIVEIEQRVADWQSK
ncbi:tRNA (adenosine(37)-N6)-dimethylallyltransferase MiaA [Furfurilactobacillus curtus]|uniref:tRNA dimethylallyltransferase n=1 Tax=Furfurilactobacillus curtus TaxID=1746200 RepID=A0ABQ5JKZ3_9LACO